MGGLVLFGTLGIITLLFYEKISKYLYKLPLFNKLQTQEGVKWSVISFGVSLIFIGFLFYYSEYILISLEIPNKLETH